MKNKKQTILETVRDDVSKQVKEENDRVKRHAQHYAGKNPRAMLDSIRSFYAALIISVLRLLNPQKHQAELEKKSAVLTGKMTEFDQDISEADAKQKQHEINAEAHEGQQTFDYEANEVKLGKISTNALSLVEGLFSSFSFLGLFSGLIPVAILVSLIFALAFKAATYVLAKCIRDAETKGEKIAMWAVAFVTSILLFGALGFVRKLHLINAGEIPIPISVSICISSFFFLSSILISYKLVIPSKEERIIKKKTDYEIKAAEKARLKKEKLQQECDQFKQPLIAEIALHQQVIDEAERYRRELEIEQQATLDLFHRESGLHQPVIHITASNNNHASNFSTSKINDQ